MGKILDYHAPFSEFAKLNFVNCFSSAYMFCEGMKGEDDYDCKKRRGEACDGCGRCRKSSFGLQEDVFFWFDTLCGRSSLRQNFEGTPTEMQSRLGETAESGMGERETVDFLFGLAGYEYKEITEPREFESAVRDFIDAGRPLIADTGDGEGRFRVISGYESDTPVCPDFQKAQKPPEKPLAYADIRRLFAFVKKIDARYGLKDGLKRVVSVMEYNESAGLWKEFEDRLGWYGEKGMRGLSPEQMKERMKRVNDAMWHTFNSHNFAEVFRDRTFKETQSGEYDRLCAVVAPTYGYTHDLAWALIGLYEQLDWSKFYAFGIAEMVQLALSQIHKNDVRVLGEIKSIIAQFV